MARARRQPYVFCHVLGYISHNGIGTFTQAEGNINSRKYFDILNEKFWPVLAWLFPNNDYLFEEINARVQTSNEKENDEKSKAISNL